MRAVVQRVDFARCYVEDKVVEIGKGILVFLGISKYDTEEDVDYMVTRILNLRIFEHEGKSLSVKDLNYDIMIIPQFTLYGDVRWGNRPSFDDAQKKDIAFDFYKSFVGKIRKEYGRVAEGFFGEFMKVELLNSGPYTILVDSKRIF